MTKLWNLLKTRQAPIASALLEHVRQHDPARFEALKQTLGQSLSDALAALAEHEEGAGDGHVRAWAAHQADLVAGLELAPTVLLSGLDALAGVLRAEILQRNYAGPELAGALAQLDTGLALLRNLVVEAALGNQWQQLITLVQGSSEMLCLATVKGKLFYINAAGQRLVGLQSERVPNANLQEFYPEATWKMLLEVGFAQVRKSGRWEGAAQLKHLGTGELIDVELVMHLVRNPLSAAPLCLAIVQRDVRGRKQAEEIDERKNAILESALDPILTIDHEGRVTEFNRAAERTFQRNRSEVLGKKPEELLFPQHQGKGGWVERYVSAREGSMLGKRTEITALRAGGDEFPAEMAMTISLQHGSPVFTFFLRDITERKRAEEAQAHYSAELAKSNAELAERNEELKQFAYVASHDLQEPLRAVASYCQLLQRRYQGQLDKDADEFIGFAVDGATRMQALINGLLEYSRVGTAAFQLDSIDAQSAVEEALSNLEMPLKETGAVVNTDGLPRVKAHRLQLVQLFQNLIGNALKYRGDIAPEVHIFAQGRRDEWVFGVRDNGIGIDEKHFKRIFVIFQRLHSREEYPGTGIGLAICKRIVERHGGTLWLESKPGQGTTFFFTLPRRGAAA